MEEFAYTIEKMFQEKLRLYTDLKTILEQEKKYIIDMDVVSLWKMAERKKKLVSEIEQIREWILCLFEENKVPLNRELKFFNLSHVINGLPFPEKMKSDLKKIKVELTLVKQDISGLAIENKRYTNEYLSVINGIFATITGSKNREQYTRAGMVLEDKARKNLIRAEG